MNNNSRHASLPFRLISGFEHSPRLLELWSNLLIRVALIKQLVLQDNELELDLAFAIVLENVLIGAFGDAGGALVVVKAFGLGGELVGLGPDEELVGLDVAVGAGAPGGLESDAVVHGGGETLTLIWGNDLGVCV